MSRTSTELLSISPAPPIVLNTTSYSPGASLRLVGDDLISDALSHERAESLTQHASGEISKAKGAIVIVTVSSMTLLNSMLNGVLTVGLPKIAEDLALQGNLLLWPASVYALTCGCTLLLSGSIADVIGSRVMYLTGCVLLTGFTLACGLARTGLQMIVFRAISGVAISFCLPSAVSIITSTFPTGQRRNIAFACLGAAQPLGFSLGLVVGGLVVGSIGWRYAYYLTSIAIVMIFALASWGLPKDARGTIPEIRQRLAHDIDWIGALLASTPLGMFSYVFAAVTGSTSKLRDPANLTLLCTAVALIPAFIFWVGRQEKLGRPAIIPNSLWKNTIFTCICIAVAVAWAVSVSCQYFMTLFFQNLQHLTPIQTSIRFIPMVISGSVVNVATGFLVHRVSAYVLILSTVAATAFSPFLMAIADPKWSYWYVVFLANLLAPISIDTLFTVSNLVITSLFPSKTQGLAGGVFNTLAQIGNSVGLAVGAVIASSVTASSPLQDKSSTQALEEGYKAAFWLFFAAQAAILVVTGWGLRKIGKVGLKRD